MDLLAERLDDIGFKSTMDDPDMWINLEVKPYG